MVRTAMILVGVLAAMVVLGGLLLDEGEIVKLVTIDAEEREHETQLWVVEVDGDSYLRAANPEVAWLVRARVHPEVFVEVREMRRPYRAEFDVPEAVSSAVDRAMAQKYGLADRVFCGLTDRAVAIRLREIGGAVPVARGAHP